MENPSSSAWGSPPIPQAAPTSDCNPLASRVPPGERAAASDSEVSSSEADLPSLVPKDDDAPLEDERVNVEREVEAWRRRRDARLVRS